MLRKIAAVGATIALLVLVVMRGPASAAVALVQTPHSASSASSNTITTPATAGHIVACVLVGGSGTLSVTDSNSVALTQEANLPAGSFGNDVAIFDYVVVGTPTGVYTFNATVTRSTCYELSGAAGIGASASYASNTATSATNVVITDANVQSVDVQIGGCASAVTSNLAGTYSNGSTTSDIAAANKAWTGHAPATSTASSTLTCTAASTTGNYQGAFADYTPGILTVIDFTSGTTCTIPANFLSLVSIEAIGGGGAGISRFDANSNDGTMALGGGGGAYAKITTVSGGITAGTGYTCQIGTGGVGVYSGWPGTSVSGTDTLFKNGSSTTVLDAAPGLGPTTAAGTPTAGAGGSTGASTGSTLFAGGNGGANSTGGGGGGGGAAGPNGAGCAGGLAGASVGFGAGGGGGADGGSCSTPSAPIGQNGSTGGNGNGGAGGGTGGSSGTPNGGTGGTSVSGAGGGGGWGNWPTGAGGVGGAGGAGAEWTLTAGGTVGAGGGAGAADFDAQTNNANGGLYGGGGGGGGGQTGSGMTPGNGAPGVLILTYYASGGGGGSTPPKLFPYPYPALFRPD